MKKNILLLLFPFLLLSCEGSDTYQGKWKALDKEGNKLEIEFFPKKLTLLDSLGKSINYEYTQNSIESDNSIKTYGITLSDGRIYQIYFPKKDCSIGLILDENDNQIFTLSRNSYVDFDEIYKLY